MVSLKSFFVQHSFPLEDKKTIKRLYRKMNLNTVHEMVGHADERTTLGNYCFDRNTEVEKANLIEKASAC